jgi:hypothetical protein
MHRSRLVEIKNVRYRSAYGVEYIKEEQKWRQKKQFWLYH